MRRIMLPFMVVFLLGAPLSASALYESAIEQARSWLTQQQNADGSWGVLETERFIATTEVVKALHASGARTEAYYRGVTWLQNRAGNNVDYGARRAVALSASGTNTASQWIPRLSEIQDPALSGHEGWGLSSHYLESPLDTALALEALARIGTAAGGSNVSIQPALDYLKNAQVGQDGWPLGQQSGSDPFVTALVVKGLAPWVSQDSALTPLIEDGVANLVGQMNSAEPIVLQALAAHAALLVGNTAAASAWLSSMALNQASNGSWEARAYDTALVVRAMAAADGLDSGNLHTVVSIPDANLRRAINVALGRGALDALNRGDLAQLTTLDASNLGITDLTGLEWAVNLVHLDVSDNQIVSLDPIASLSLETLDTSGNPVGSGRKEVEQQYAESSSSPGRVGNGGALGVTDTELVEDTPAVGAADLDPTILIPLMSSM
ncbi:MULTISPECIES: hypothetical protein [Alloalcanivorax]|jgi:hypothetical protein|uniref:YD repeat protein n=2 Tax=Alloalcanivorax TaxID=3020832 RepID=K0CFJ4_ALCDB|nr:MULTISPECIES: hypothetical protein [Alloalcanivorax]ERS13457.1 hypothetical protein Q668_14510 [Alcanivorax sp. PN-3]AFT70361.1 YD repeat protein [Alloalcanivorax dieselolei B5]ARB45705.1 hypothetical protein P40_09980 [Alloalcanivorax xenomutans]MCE7510347.1 hypothetical protein [Alloalcanivorax xenomutans]WOA33434.1 hypothetical protein RVY87_10190 [Alloalcanivorax xenomutans]